MEGFGTGLEERVDDLQIGRLLDEGEEIGEEIERRRRYIFQVCFEIKEPLYSN